ncbi:hypothetical protein Acr_11g0000310 [Actinidia rufa]|uniref:Uncharacterized protein n=1 Tax=Actinidia rufa TaxID=165716 RepID=A0A7J0FAP9_9ERIC|nr:hypothetical protein Acr_11g0000310 [Actinidia rufa]
MDPEVTVDPSNKVEDLSRSSMEKLDGKFVVVKAKDNVELPQPSQVAANRAASIGPITPELNRESGDSLFDFASPLTLISSPHKAVCFDSHSNDNLCSSTDGSPCTPVEGVFDPFAPGPDKLMQAPHCRKYLEELWSNVARRLNFGSSVNFVRDGNSEAHAETISDEMLLETVYDSLLEAIFSKQTEGFRAEILSLDPDSDGFKTPNSEVCLSGIAETCPGAPVKSVRKSKNIDRSLYRKLEF